METNREPVPAQVYKYTITLSEQEVSQMLFIMGLNVSIPEKFGVKNSPDLNEGELHRFMSELHAALNKSRNPRKNY